MFAHAPTLLVRQIGLVLSGDDLHALVAHVDLDAGALRRVHVADTRNLEQLVLDVDWKNSDVDTSMSRRSAHRLPAAPVQLS